MQKYQSHKIVEAAQITDVHTVPGGAHLYLKDEGSKTAAVDSRWLYKHSGPDHSLTGGYFVRYDDGYTSWSPAEAFEQGYAPFADGQIKGLPVLGYKPTQSAGSVALVSSFKVDEELLLRKLDALRQDPNEPGVDQRWLAIGRTALEQAFMAINRAVFQPQRVELPEDAPGIG